MGKRIFYRLAVVVFGVMSNATWGQNTPATAPGTAPATRAARGPISSSPREKLPFTNGSLTAVDPKLPTFFITGDSTAARNGDPDHRGWGAFMIDYFDTAKINLVNQAQAGANFPGYYATRWPAVVAAMKPGDFVVVEFGHNTGHAPGTGDETQERPGRASGAATTVHTYGWYVRQCIREAKAKGATPIISSTTTRNMWTNPNAKFNDGTITEKNDKYNPAEDKVEHGMGSVMPDGRRSMTVWAEQVAEEEKAAFVDHSEITALLYEKMGREAVQRYFPADHTHTSTDGGALNAETFIAGLKVVPDMPLVNYLNEKGKGIAAYKTKNTGL